MKSLQRLRNSWTVWDFWIRNTALRDNYQVVKSNRVAIVRSLLMHPEVILFDEVTASLDPEMVREVLELINDLAQEGCTMLIVTHELQFARAIADRIIFMDKGVIAEEGTAEEFFNHPKTQRAQEFLNVFDFSQFGAYL